MKTTRESATAGRGAASTSVPATAVVAGDGWVAHLRTSVIATFVLALMVCGVYPALVWAVSRIPGLSGPADGSLIYSADGKTVIGSSLIGQNFTEPGYFHPRPSAAGNGYDPTATGGTNLGPTSDKLINGVHGSKNADGTANPAGDFDGVADLVKAYRAENGLAADAAVPADAVTRSASGVDPHISVANARLQMARVAKARGMSADALAQLVAKHTERRSLGILGEEGVNVLSLNMALGRAGQ